MFECAGGYAPTIGIIGAVMGLIQVMKNLANIDEVGHGIAVAFVATVYGVGARPICFLCRRRPRSRRASHAETQRKELILEGVSRHRGGSESEADPHQAGSVTTQDAPAEGEVKKKARAPESAPTRQSAARRCNVMARKKKPPEHDNHERWLVSYADFITLLFAFFVVMFATSQTDKGKAQQVSDSVKKALEGEKMSAGDRGHPGRHRRR